MHYSRFDRALDVAGGCLLLLAPFVVALVLGVILMPDGERTVPGVVVVNAAFFGLLFLCGRRAHALSHEIRELSQKSLEETLRDDSRPPILYLRSFLEDDTRPQAPIAHALSPFTWGAIGTKQFSYEEKLVSELAPIGPVIALSNPVTGKQGPGAAKFSVEHGKWKAEVEKQLEVCSYVILRIGYTQGLMWELQRLVQGTPPEKIIIFLQVGDVSVSSIQEARYQRWRKSVEEHLPRGLPERIGKNRYICFDADWTPHAARTVGAVFRHKGKSYDSPARVLLKALLPYAKAPETGTLSMLALKESGPRSPHYSLWLWLVLVALAVPAAAAAAYEFIAFHHLHPLLGFVPFVPALLVAGIAVGLAGRYARAPGGRRYLFLGGLSAGVFVYIKWLVLSMMVMDDAAGIISMPSGPIAHPPVMFDAVLSYYEFFERMDPELDGIFDGLIFIWTMETIIVVAAVPVLVWVYGLSHGEAAGHVKPSPDALALQR